MPLDSDQVTPCGVRHRSLLSTLAHSSNCSPAYERRPHWQLGSCESKCLACQSFVDALHLVQHPTGLNACHPVLNITLALPLTDLQRLLGYWFVRKDANPNLCPSFDFASNCSSSRLDLSGSDPPSGNGFHPIFTETHTVPSCCHPSITAFLLLAILGSFWLHHGVLAPHTTAASDCAPLPVSPRLKISPLKIHVFTPITP